MDANCRRPPLIIEAWLVCSMAFFTICSSRLFHVCCISVSSWGHGVMIDGTIRWFHRSKQTDISSGYDNWRKIIAMVVHELPLLFSGYDNVSYTVRKDFLQFSSTIFNMQSFCRRERRLSAQHIEQFNNKVLMGLTIMGNDDVISCSPVMSGWNAFTKWLMSNTLVSLYTVFYASS